MYRPGQHEFRDLSGVLAVAPGEAARLAGVGRTTIYEAIGSGALKSAKIGKRRLITIEAIKVWLQVHEVGGTTLPRLAPHASPE